MIHISALRNKKWFKASCMFMAINMLGTAFPTVSYGLTGGPSQPEFSAFTPLGTNDMVDMSSGDFSYNIPLMDVGGYPLNLGYKSGVTTDQEASWVGLGWNLSVGQINRNVRGLPDDFKGDEMNYQNYMKPNKTYGANFQVTPALFGANFLENIPPNNGVTLSFGMEMKYNNYNGVSISPSLGVSYSMSGASSLSFNVQSTPEGLAINPSVSFSETMKSKKGKETDLKASVGVAFNSRQGITSTNMGGQVGEKKGSITFPFINKTYTPTNSNAMINNNFTFNAALGAELFGGEAQGQITGYGSVQKLAENEKDKTEYAYGYEHTDEAKSTDILDLNREKDGSFSVNSTNLPLVNYTYDMYSIQGQGIGGTFRPHRSGVGHLYDQQVSNTGASVNLGLEIGGGNAVHAGLDIEVSPHFGGSGKWQYGNYAVQHLTGSDQSNRLDYEKVYFKNIGDLSTDFEYTNLFENKLGGYQPMHVHLGGGKYTRHAASEFKVKSTSSPNSFGTTPINSKIERAQRLGRNTSILKMTAGEMGKMGLGSFVNSNAQQHHTAGFRIVRNDGARYNYYNAIYNNVKKEVTFSMAGATGDCTTGLVSYNPGIDNKPEANTRGDQYFNAVKTPAYAHTYLLSSILSADYSDIDGVNGPSPNDLGTYTLFKYQQKTPVYKWRVPYKQNKATYNEGLKTKKDDDRGNYIYGEKELVYIEKIETKTHVAVFKLNPRKDGYGVNGENGGWGSSSKMYQLEKIELFAKPEYDADPTNATPIKTAHFVYDYSLCKGVPNNLKNINNSTETSTNEMSNEGGKLTLRKVYFTYRDSKMGQYSDYHFNYADINHDGNVDGDENPSYNLKAYDIWGGFKPNVGGCYLTSTITAPEYNYVEQDSQEKADKWSAAWSLTSIELPSGGEIKVHYESDDYEYVQDKRAMQMFKVFGAGEDSNPAHPQNGMVTTLANNEGILYKSNASKEVHNYLYVKLPEGLGSTDAEAKLAFIQKCLTPLADKPIYFRFLTNMTRSGGRNTGWTSSNRFDYVTGYCFLKKSSLNASAIHIGTISGQKYISVPIQEDTVGANDDAHPISKAGWQFGRKFLNQLVYGFSDLDETQSPQGVFAQIFAGPVLNLIETFQGPNNALRQKLIARRFIPGKAWIRLGLAKKKKLGGGSRVKKIEMLDKWDTMTGLDTKFGQFYGQEYEYKLENGASSGVATYEPIGGKENPFIEPVFSYVNRLLAPDEENYVEKPFGESFFPSPAVTYSRVTVKNIGRNKVIGGVQKEVKKHATGKVVHEFYTSKDYPTKVDLTKPEVHEDNDPVMQSLLNIFVMKHLTMSQGYLIHLNDMNGKPKAQWVYPEGQDSYISGVEYLYDGYTSAENDQPGKQVSANKGKLKNTVPVIKSDGTVEQKTIGVEYDVNIDFRENKTQTETIGLNTNLASFFVGVIPGLVPVPLPDFAHHEDQFRSTSTTKVVQTYGILKETIAHDVGASVSTRNLAWDALTGEVLLTETINEYNDKYYSISYPAHWYYDGMGMAYKNVAVSGKIQHASGTVFNLDNNVGVNVENVFLHNGDEILIENQGQNIKAWVDNVGTTSFQLINQSGAYLNGTQVPTGSKFKIYRSGRRNLQSGAVMSVTSQVNPLDPDGDGTFNNITPTTLSANSNAHKVINANAVEYKDNWDLQCDCNIDPQNTVYNPYLYNKKGVWRTVKSHLYLTGRINSGDPHPRQEGFYVRFSPFYKRSGNNWVIDNTNWTHTSEVTQFSPHGFELENKDALNRYSGAQYGYNNKLPMAVGANGKYAEIGYDGFEDYKGFNSCGKDEHFGFRKNVDANQQGNTISHITEDRSHTGRYSVKVPAGKKVATKVYRVGQCPNNAQP